MEQKFCSSCQFSVSESFFFCPNCGKKLKDTLLSISIGRQIGLYALSVLLPPLGLFPGIKYLLQADQKRKLVGLVIVLLTIVSTALTILLTMNLLSQISKSLNSQLYQNSPLLQ